MLYMHYKLYEVKQTKNAFKGIHLNLVNAL